MNTCFYCNESILDIDSYCCSKDQKTFWHYRCAVNEETTVLYLTVKEREELLKHLSSHKEKWAESILLKNGYIESLV